MKDMNFKNWTESFAQAIIGSMLSSGHKQTDQFLSRKLQQSVRMLDNSAGKIYSCSSANDYYNMLCVFLNEIKNCVYWYQRSLEYKQVNPSKSQMILSQAKSMNEVLESALRVIKYQENLQSK